MSAKTIGQEPRTALEGVQVESRSCCSQRIPESGQQVLPAIKPEFLLCLVTTWPARRDQGATKQSEFVRDLTALQETFQAYLDERPALLAQLVRSGSLVLRRVIFKLLPIIVKGVCPHPHCTSLSKAEVRKRRFMLHSRRRTASPDDTPIVATRGAAPRY